MQGLVCESYKYVYECVSCCKETHRQDPGTPRTQIRAIPAQPCPPWFPLLGPWWNSRHSPVQGRRGFELSCGPCESCTNLDSLLCSRYERTQAWGAVLTVFLLIRPRYPWGRAQQAALVTTGLDTAVCPELGALGAPTLLPAHLLQLLGGGSHEASCPPGELTRMLAPLHLRHADSDP